MKRASGAFSIVDTGQASCRHVELLKTGSNVEEESEKENASHEPARALGRDCDPHGSRSVRLWIITYIRKEGADAGRGSKSDRGRGGLCERAQRTGRRHCDSRRGWQPYGAGKAGWDIFGWAKNFNWKGTNCSPV